MIRIDDLIEKVSAYLPEIADLSIISKAYVYSARLHRERFSEAGTPVLQHAVEVSSLLADFRLGIACIAAGLLHDVLEEELADPESLREMVGSDVAGLVAELATLNRASFHGSVAARAEHMRQMILASTHDIRVILILLADRLQYLRTWKALPVAARQAQAREAFAIYAPIAHRLGVHSIKAELEDLAFRILEPKTFARIQREVQQRLSARQARLEGIHRELSALLKENGVEGEVLGRTKHLYSIHSKMMRDRLDMDGIHDLLATRIVVAESEECYRVLGMIHAAYTPMPGKFRDYIALPKSNGYQSLHTYVFGTGGDIFEIQIRTREMHNQAELGVAAHFTYKDGHPVDERELANVAWFRHLLENLEAGQDPRESMELLARDLEPEQIFVFTPAGEVIKLPVGATPIDFAYAVHTTLGHRCQGAKVDGRIASIREPLAAGAVVEILTNRRQDPKKDWLKHVVSAKALSRIRSFLRNQERAEAIERGREQALKEAGRLVGKPEELVKMPEVRAWMRENQFGGADDFFAAIGGGRVNLREVLATLFPDRGRKKKNPERQERQKKSAPVRQAAAVRIAGFENLLVRFAKCCSPAYGQPLKGIITRGGGVSVHRPDCHNLNEQAVREGRVVDAEWIDARPEGRAVTLAVRATLESNRLADVIERLEREEGLAIASKGATSKNGLHSRELILEAKNPNQINNILRKLNAIEGIHAKQVSDPG